MASVMTMILCLFCLWCSLISTTNAIGNGAIRMYRSGVPDTSQSWSSGIVQIYYNNQWGNICEDGFFGSDEADVVCHQLGYTGASLYSNTGIISTYGDDLSASLIDDVSCSSSSYLTITQCTFSTSSSCSDSFDLVITCYSTRIWDSPSPGDIRLTGGTYSNQGLLEVYCNGQWGTVCDDSFYSTSAIIACSQLGYNDYVSYDHLSFQINNSLSIWLRSQSSCTTADTCLTSCGTCPLTSLTICSHSEDITLECEYTSSSAKETAVTTSTCYDREPAPVGTVRLLRNGVPDTTQSWSSGIVQIFFSDKWGNICDDSTFGSSGADAICRQLGYTGASSYSNTGSTTTWGIDTSDTVIDDVACSGNFVPLTITQCTYSTSFTSFECNDATDVIVDCYSTRIWDSPSPGDIRLTRGKYSNEGLLEVYCNGQWGTVCDNSFYGTEATLACRQLGYNDYDTYDQLTQRGNSSQNIWLTVTDSCSTSSDSCLTSCGNCPTTGITSCSHSEDITLACEHNTGLASVSTYNTNGACTSGNDADAFTGAVRFLRNNVYDVSQTWSSGIVQYYDDRWGNICLENFGSTEAEVICHQLGFTGYSSYSSTGTTTTWGSDGSPTVLTRLTCSSSTYLTVTQCSFTTNPTSSDCDDTTDLVLSCYSTRLWDSPSTGDIRLNRGTYSNVGLLEIYCSGEWGTVCDDYFDANEARVACRQLGYNYYARYDNSPLRGSSSQPIWLWETYSCSSSSSISTYSCLTNCEPCPLRSVVGCSHSEDINLACRYNPSFAQVSTDTSNTCDISETNNTGAIVGAIVGSILGFIVCIVMMVAIPICICACLGVGLGASASRSTPRTRVVTQPTTAPATATAVTVGVDKQQPPQQPPPAATTTAPYPAQQPPPGYSTVVAPNPAYNPAAPVYNPGYPQTTVAYPYPTVDPNQQPQTVMYPANPEQQQPQGYAPYPPQPAGGYPPQPAEYNPAMPPYGAGQQPPPQYP